MRRESSVEGEVLVGDGQVVIRRARASEVAIAKVLGTEEEGARIYLDRLVHAPWEDEIAGWRCTGAISTILERVTTGNALSG